MSHKKEVMNVIISSFNNQGMTRLALDALLVDFESQIRQDQKEKCVANINEETCSIFNQTFFEAVSVSEVLEAIMNADN